MKKIYILIFSFFCFFSLVGCGKKIELPGDEITEKDYILNKYVNDNQIKIEFTPSVHIKNLKIKLFARHKRALNLLSKKHPDIEKLPRRTDGGFTGLHGQCYDIKINKNKLSFTVYYSGDIYHVKDVIFNTENDLNFLKGVKKFYYYTDGLDKMFVVYYDDDIKKDNVKYWLNINENYLIYDINEIVNNIHKDKKYYANKTLYITYNFDCLSKFNTDDLKISIYARSFYYYIDYF